MMLYVKAPGFDTPRSEGDAEIVLGWILGFLANRSLAIVIGKDSERGCQTPRSKDAAVMDLDQPLGLIGNMN